MAAFLYRCPNTGQHVQGWSAKEVRADETSYRHLHRVPTGASRESRNRPRIHKTGRRDNRVRLAVFGKIPCLDGAFRPRDHAG